MREADAVDEAVEVASVGMGRCMQLCDFGDESPAHTVDSRGWQEEEEAGEN
jgi:hypothetical protein